MFNSPSNIFGLGHHGVCRRSPPLPHMAKEKLLNTYLKKSAFISWSLYLPSHVLIPNPHRSTSSWYLLCPYAQFLFSGNPPILLWWTALMGHIRSLALRTRWYMRGISLHPLFPPFQSSVGMYPGCGHFFPVVIYPISSDTTSSYSSTSHSNRSGEGGPSAQTPSAGQQPAVCAGSGIGRYWPWGPLTQWDIGDVGVLGPPPIRVSAPRWRSGGMRWW